MGTTETLLVVAPLKPLEVGQEFKTTPPHLTVYPPFQLNTDNWPAFSSDMENLMLETEAPLIIGGSSVMYGPNEDLEARRLDRLSPTFNILRGFDVHAGVYRSAHELGTGHDETYTGLNWSPHVSGADLAAEESAQLTMLAVIKKMEQRQKMVKAVFKWSDYA